MEVVKFYLGFEKIFKKITQKIGYIYVIQKNYLVYIFLEHITVFTDLIEFLEHKLTDK